MSFRDTITLLFVLIAVLLIGGASGWFLRSCSSVPLDPEVIYIDTGTANIVYKPVYIEKWKYKTITKTDSVKVWDTVFQEYTTPYHVTFDSNFAVNTVIQVLNADSTINNIREYQTKFETFAYYDHPARELTLRQNITSVPQKVFPVIIIKKYEKPWYDESWFKAVSGCAVFGAGVWVGVQAKN